MNKLSKSNLHPNAYEYRGLIINYHEDYQPLRHVFSFSDSTVNEHGEEVKHKYKAKGKSIPEGEDKIIKKADNYLDNCKV